MSKLTQLAVPALALALGSVGCGADDDESSPVPDDRIEVGNEPPPVAIDIPKPPAQLPKQKSAKKPARNGGADLGSPSEPKLALCGDKICPPRAPVCVWHHGEPSCIP